MASFVKYERFSEDLAEGVHQLHAAGHTLKVALTNTAPTVATDAALADITEIGAGSGYTAGGDDVQNDTSRSGGTTSVTGSDVTFTASGGSIGPFRYAVLYNATADKLIGYWDYGAEITLAAGESFTVDVGSSLLTVA